MAQKPKIRIGRLKLRPQQRRMRLGHVDWPQRSEADSRQSEPPSTKGKSEWERE